MLSQGYTTKGTRPWTWGHLRKQARPLGISLRRSPCECRGIGSQEPSGAAPFETSSTVPTRGTSAAQSNGTSAAADVPYTIHKWKYGNHNINYAVAGCGEPILLVHGFGASVGHYKKSIPVLAKSHKVYALDLLGFGASDKPGIKYTMEVWRDLVVAFIDEFMDRPPVLVGNSLGSLICLMVAAALPDRTRGLVLLNCAGAMNNKGVVGDWRILLVYPIFLIIDLLLHTPGVADFLFNKFRSPDNIRNVLQQVYVNQEAVDDELVDMILKPSDDPGALPVFVSVITGPPGPKPWDLVPQIKCPLMILWGDTDIFTPVDGPVGQYLRALPDTREDTRFVLLENMGHCPQDDRPEAVHEQLLPWLQELRAVGQVTVAAGAPEVQVEA